MGKLRADQDAYGHEIRDHHRGKAGQEIIERSDGFIDGSAGPSAYFTEYADWRACDRRAIDMARGRVLDIGCGAGRHALYLQSKGLDVLGVDLSPLAIKTCKLRGLKKTKIASITDASPRWGTFDTIIMFGHNFGLFGTFARARRLLRRFGRMTSPAGRLIVQSLDPYQTDEPWHKRYHRQNLRRGRMAGQARIRVRYKGWISPWFDYLLVSQDEMRKVLDGTGWQVRRFYDSPGPGYAALIEKAKG